MPIPEKPDLSASERFFAARMGDGFAQLAPAPGAPAGYPGPQPPDEYRARPLAPSYQERRRWFLDHWATRPALSTVKGAYAELARLELGVGPIHEPLLLRVVGFVNRRYDCADFTIHLLLRILYQYADSPLLASSTIAAIEEAVLDFKYSPWEPGSDSMCSWTENHQILFAAAEYLAGRRYPGVVFANEGRTGAAKQEWAAARIGRWLELRFTTGFSEWLSHVYYDEDITALLSLADFAADGRLAERARMVLDLIFIEIAAHSLHGVFGSTHGRSYPREKRFGDTEATSDLCTVAFGTGRTTGADAMGAFALAVSPTYAPPALAVAIARGPGDASSAPRTAAEEIRQRCGFDIREARRWGIDPHRELDAFMLLSQEAYFHPRSVRWFLRLMDRFGWWENSFFSPFRRFKGLFRVLRTLGLLPALAWIVRKDATRNTREAVSVHSRRSAHAMLSAAIDYRPGFGGDQQHIWQATLGPRAVVFVNHPADHGSGSAGYWVGDGNLPRVVMYRRNLIALYRPSHRRGLYKTNRLFFTHAWFPREEFDELCEIGRGPEADPTSAAPVATDGVAAPVRWFCARYGKGYVALASRNRAQWGGEAHECEIVAAEGPNIWICRIGEANTDGSFERFVESCRDSRIDWAHPAGGGARSGRLEVRWQPPGEPELRFGWRAPLRVDGQRQNLHERRRFDAPFATDAETAIGARRYSFSHGGQRLRLDYDMAVRDETTD